MFLAARQHPLAASSLLYAAAHTKQTFHKNTIPRRLCESTSPSILLANPNVAYQRPLDRSAHGLKMQEPLTRDAAVPLLSRLLLYSVPFS